MADRTDQIVELIKKFHRNELSVEENDMLQKWIAENEENQKFLKFFTDEDLMIEEMRLYMKYEDPTMWPEIEKQINSPTK